jgi:hypothetical protein
VGPGGGAAEGAAVAGGAASRWNPNCRRRSTLLACVLASQARKNSSIDRRG